MSNWWNTEMKTGEPIAREEFAKFLDKMIGKKIEVRPNTMMIRCRNSKCDKLMEVFVECSKCPLCGFAWV